MAETRIGFRAVHPDFRSSKGFRWPFPGGIAEAPGPFTDNPDKGCPSNVGDGICLAHTAAGMASGGIPAITVLVCRYSTDDLLGTEPDGSKVRVRRAEVLRVVDFPATLRGELPADPDLPTIADLSGANLSGADLSRADLSRANLSWANLSGANLSGAHLSGADLSRADLSRANLSWANLSWADPSWADLSGTDLSGANLSRANLYGADLSGAKLSGTDLSGTDLSRANLYGADLSGAKLSRADLSGANLSRAWGNRWTALPEGCGWTITNGRIVKAGA